MINYIFGFFLIVGIVYGSITGNINSINDVFIVDSKSSIEMVLNMIPLLCLWLGIMKIAGNSGLIKKISMFMSCVIHPIFPELNKNSDAISYISSNIVMNMLGLGSGATPFGLKAMDELNKENNNSDTASRSMITFLVINTASVTIIPTTVISFRALNGSNNPTDILLACIITTFLSCLFGILLDKLMYRIWSKYD
ncbi:MAG: spore maturation protein [Bacilli bacterium]|nr:spore maturation protein [Bacilli bacterium]